MGPFKIPFLFLSQSYINPVLINMKNIFMFLIFILNLTSCSNIKKTCGDSEFKDKFIYASDIYGPFDGTENISLSYSYKYIGNSEARGIQDKLDIYYLYNNQYLCVYSKIFTNNMYIFNGYTFESGEVVIPNSKTYLEEGFKYKVGPYNSKSKEYLDCYEGYINKTTPSTIDPFYYRNKPFIVDNHLICINKSVNTKESFLFDEYKDFIEIDEYNRIRFDKLTFKYESSCDFVYQKATISFLDKNNLFSNINKDINGLSYIDVSLVKDEEDRVSIITPKYKYNKYTLQIIQGDEGDVSPYIYSPRGQSYLLETYTFNLCVLNMGHASISFSLDFEVLADNISISSSPSSKYKIIGGIVQ